MKPKYRLTGKMLPYIGFAPGVRKRAGTRDELLFVVRSNSDNNVAFVLERSDDDSN